ncbi:MAG: hypothetical protein ACE5RJ_06105 [Nitrosopumilaceae archaeon]
MEKIRDILFWPIFIGVMILFVIILPFFAIAYRFFPGFAKAMDELYADDPLVVDDY